MNRFFGCANRVEVVALYVPAVGPDHARKAVEAAGKLLRATADLVPVTALRASTSATSSGASSW